MIRDQAHDVFAFARLEALWRDVRQGIRSLRRNPVMLIISVLSLGIGIGATSTLYSVVDALVFHDVTAREPGRLVTFAPVSYPTYRDLRGSGAFEDLAAGNQCYPALRWRDGEHIRAVIADCLSANFFDVVGGHAALGRVFTASDAAPEQNPRMVLVSDRFWRRQLGGDANVVGRALTFNDTSFSVVGVLPPDYRAITGYGLAPDVFVPFNTGLHPRLFDRHAPASDQMRPVGRLAASRTLEQTRRALTPVLQRLAEQFPDPTQRAQPPLTLMPVEGIAKYGDGGSFAGVMLSFFKVLGAVTAATLLIACANVAGLLLARGMARRREMAVRLALGAARSQLVRQLLVEATILAAIGTSVGIGLTFWAAWVLADVDVPVQDVTLRFAFSPDWRFAAAVAALGTVATLASGLVPALASSRSGLVESLRVNRSSAAPRLRLRSLLVIGQVALSVVLLSGAFLFVRNLVNVVRDDPGFDTAHTAWFDFGIDRRAPQAEQVARRDRLHHALESSPGVQAVSWTWYLPFQVVYPEPLLRRADGKNAEGIHAIEQGVGPGYLKTLGIRLVAGREFVWDDLKPRDSGVPPPVIINDALAHTLFQGRVPIGEPLMRIAHL